MIQSISLRGVRSGVAWVCLNILLLPAFAHSVWVEPDKEGALIVRFAEPDGKFEKSPGHLDSLTIPAAFMVGANGQATNVMVEKKSDHFALLKTTAEKVTGIETTFSVMASEGRPGRRPIFYARWQPAGAKAGVPSLTLDLVPSEKAGEVRVYFRGKPLGGIKAVLRTPDEKEVELVADSEGFIRFEPKQSGQHLLTVARHRENLGGYHGGVAYELTSHNASLSWRQP